MFPTKHKHLACHSIPQTKAPFQKAMLVAIWLTTPSDLLVDLTWSLSSDLEPVARDGQLDKKAFRRQYSLPEVRLQHRGAGQLSDPFYRLCVFS